MRPATGRGLLYVTMFGAGFAGLVLEVLWIRSLGLVFGANTHAMSTVLAAYMAGLALGSLVIGRWTGKPERTPVGLGRMYALLLAGLGVSGVLVTLLASRLSFMAVPVLRAVGWNSGMSVAIRGLLGFVILLLPTFIIGGMMPVAAQLSVEHLDTVGRRLASLYFVNTLGSVVGTLLAGFLLLERLGVTGTALLTGLTSLLLAPLALAVRTYVPAPPVPEETGGGARPLATPVPPVPRVRYPRAAVAVLAAGFALSGFAALGYEVTWTRALVTIIGQPLYGASVVLAAFLLGLAIGGLAAGRISDRWSDPLLGFGVVEITIGIGALATLSLLARSPAILTWLTGWLGTTWASMVFGLAGFCLGAMLLPAFWMGTTFPIANRAFVPGLPGLGTRVGLLYAVNTVGALLGSVITGFFIIPALGTAPTNLLLAGLGLLAGAGAILFARSRLRTRLPVLAGLGIALTLAAVFVAPHRLRVFPPTVAVGAGSTWTVSYHRETVEGIVTTARNTRTGDQQTWVNSSVVCGTGLPALKPVRLMGTVPFALHPAARDVLVIGYGLGVTASLMVSFTDRPVDCVEISPAVVEASEEFARWNNGVYDSPQLNIMAGDGRNYLLCADRQYDVISCDPTHPALGSGALYTREFYELCRLRLRKGGIMTQYLPFHKLEPGHFRTLLNTFRAAFPECALWRGIAHGVLVGRKDAKLVLDFEHTKQLFARMPPSVRSALHEVFVDDECALLSAMVLDPTGMAALTEGADIMTDDRPEIEYAGARAADTRTWKQNARLVLDAFTGPGAVTTGFGQDAAGAAGRLAGSCAAERHRFRATLCAVEGRTEDQAEELREALRRYPEDREAEAFLRMTPVPASGQPE